MAVRIGWRGFRDPEPCGRRELAGVAGWHDRVSVGNARRLRAHLHELNSRRVKHGYPVFEPRMDAPKRTRQRRMKDSGQATRKAKEKPVRLKDVAEYLGLSTTTVSLVLNNSPVAQTLSHETRKRVLKAAADLNYKANYFARALNQKRNYLIGVLVPDFGEGYNARFITAIESELIEKNYVYFVSSHHWDTKLIHQRLDGFVERGVEGMILINTPTTSFPDVPVALIGNQEIEQPCTRISLD